VHITTTFDVHVAPDRVAAWLADPRHLLVANHDGPVIEQSEGSLGPGSWFVLRFDQLRVRVEYTEFDPPRRIVAIVSMSGGGARGSTATQSFVLTKLDGEAGTRIDASVEGEGGWIRWGPLQRMSQMLTLRRLQQQIEATA
jgi:uncharacterized protein YndB with AHSA1/START domain